MEKFFHSVYLDDSLCRGCINCIKRCPTQAIRVRDGKARITSEFCIDCGECVRTCSYHAKKLHRDTLDILRQFDYTVALPAPSLYLQFNNLNNVNIVLTALLKLGFDDVFEVSAAAEVVSAATRAYVREHREAWPLISTACPCVVRLIRVRFPNLVDHLLPLKPPVEVAAEMARKQAMEKTGLPADRIGVIFLSPCPAKVTYIKDPLGIEKSQLDGALAIKDIYPLLLSHMKEVRDNPLPLSHSGPMGVGWGTSGGESDALGTDNFLATAGLGNVIRLLEDLEDDKLNDFQFIELDACDDGCVGGIFNVQIPCVAGTKLRRISDSLPPSTRHTEPTDPASIAWDAPVEYKPVFRLGSSISESISMARQVDDLVREFPGLDCGCCGAPSCRALAEDIVRGNASKHYCIHILRDHIHTLADTCAGMISDVVQKDNECSQERIQELAGQLSQLNTEITMMDVGHRPALPDLKGEQDHDHS